MDSAQENRVKTYGSRVMETDNPQKLREFRALVLTRMVKFWEDFKDIKIAVGETLAQFARRDDLTGWVRPSQAANMPALADEIARLSKENAELRSQIAQSAHSMPSYDPTPSWKEFFDLMSRLAYFRKHLDWSNDKQVVFEIETVLPRLELDATGTSTESLLPLARQLVDELLADPRAAAKIDGFRRLVAKNLRAPNEVKS